MDSLKESLELFCKSFYNDEQLEFSSDLFDKLKYLKLDDKLATAGFLLKADIGKNEVLKKSLIERFGAETVANVELLRRISGVSVNETKKNIGALRKRFVELAEDVSIIMVKLAERLITLQRADKKKSENIISLSEECLYFYSPIAQMLGIRKIYTEMEDIAFKNLYPNDFAFLEKTISEQTPVFMTKINAMRDELNKALGKYKIEAKIQSRVKRPYSIYRKLVKQKINLEKVFDLLALRVIATSSESCYLTLGIVHSNWTPIDGRFRDWITFPKSNGYRSIQTTVHTRAGDKFEIQIRTEEMHEEAEYGASAHWSYKQGGESANAGNWLRRLHDFLDNDEYFDNPFEFFDRLKSEMKRDYINVLTPKGEIISLPAGSGPIDYAFSVHTDLGLKVVGARINGKFAKIKTELKSGDVVEVMTAKNATPSRDWLNIVKTSRARSKIIRWFKKNEKELFIQQGKNAWDKLKEQYKKRLQGFEDENKFKKNLLATGYDGLEEFYYAIAGKSVKCSIYLLKKLYPDAFKKPLDKAKTAGDRLGKANLPKVEIEGEKNIEIKLSKCCNPIKGEPIIAYITKKSEMKIHSKNCPLVLQGTLDLANIKTAEWMAGEFFQNIKFKLFGESYGKLLLTAVEAAEHDKINIVATSKVELKGANECLYLEVEIKDVKQLENFVNKLKSSKAVESVKSS